MITLLRPMKAAPLLPSDVEHTNDNIIAAMRSLKFPVIATLKKDGIRSVKTDDLFSYTLKLIPNISIRTRAMRIPRGFDMELFNPELSFDEICSIVMSEKHEDSDKIEFHYIDLWNSVYGYVDRYMDAQLHAPYNTGFDVVKRPMMCRCNTTEQLMEFFLKCEAEEGEGICFRTPTSPYKQGRSTLKEQYLVKLCRYIRTEVTVIGFEEQLMNTALSKRNAIGMMDRTKSKEMKLGKNTLGKFIVRAWNGLEFSVGTGVGLTDKRRQEIWDSQDKYLNQVITIKHKPHGQKIKPRSPVFMGFRNQIDICKQN